MNKAKLLNFLERISKAKTWKKIVSGLGCAVVFVTVYALILPAITMTKKVQVLDCQYTIHQHDESCKDQLGNYICGKADYVIHTHSEECYDEEDQLVCSLPEIKAHEHTDKCLDEEGNYLCEEYIIYHIHNESCYKDGKLICEIPEMMNHEHDKECYDQAGNLICKSTNLGDHENIEISKGIVLEHKHSEECYDTKGKLSCQLLDTEEHNHEQDCIKLEEIEDKEESAKQDDENILNYDQVFQNINEKLQTNLEENNESNANANIKTVNKLNKIKSLFNSNISTMSLDETDDQYNLDNYIVSVNIQHRENDGELWENITSGTVDIGDQLRFDISYELSENTLDSTNRTIHYKVPDNITIIKSDSGTVKDSNNNAVGTYNISEDGNISITFYEDYATKNANGSKIAGHIAFESSVASIKKDDDGNISFAFKEEIELKVNNIYGDIKVEKTSYEVDSFLGTLKYRIEISSEKGTGSNVLFEDNPSNIQAINGTIKIEDKDGNTVVPLSTSENQMEFAKMNAGDKIIITYDAKLSSDAMAKLNSNEVVTANNEAKVSSTDTENSPISWSSSTSDNFNKNIISKSGEIKEGEPNVVYWTIKINSNSKARTDLSGWTLRDEFNGKSLDPNKDVIIKPNPETGNGQITTHLPYTFPADSKKVEYTITYFLDSIGNDTNKAILTHPHGETVESGMVTPTGMNIKKTFSSQDVIGTTENGDILVEQNWHINITSTSYAIQPDLVAWISGIAGTNKNVFPNGGFWQIDELVGKNMSFSQAQVRENAENIAKGLEEGGYTGNYYIFAIDQLNKYWLVKRSPNSDQYFNASYWKSITESDDNITSSKMIVILDSSWGPNKTIEFDIKNTLNAGFRIERNSYNSASIKSANINLQSGVNQTYSPPLIKLDHRVKDTSTAIMPTEYMYDETDNGTLKWQIKFNLPSSIDYTDDVVITDTLPSGLVIREHVSSIETNKYYNAYFSGDKNVFGQSDPYYFYQETTKTFDHNMNITASDGKGTISDGTYTLRYEYGEYVEIAGQLYPTQVKLIIDQGLANYIKGKSLSFSIDASIIDKDFLEKSFTNNVSMSYKNAIIDSTSQMQTVKQKAISKGVDSLTADKEIPYYVCFNTSGNDLNPISNTLELEDTLSYTVSNNSNLNLMLNHNSIKVYKIHAGDLDVDKGNTDNDVAVQLSDYLTNKNKKEYYVIEALSLGNLEDITASCPYTYTETVDEDGNNINVIKMTVPDSERVLVCYSYRVSGYGKIDGLSNIASIRGEGSESSEAISSIDLLVNQSTADAILIGVNVYKVDSKNYAIHLDGAKFDLEMWNGETWVKQNTFITDVDHGFFNTGELQENTAYRLIETEAPHGYEFKTAVTYEFYIKNTAMNAHTDCKPDGFTGKALNNGDDITIPNKVAEYELAETGGIGTKPIKLIGLGLMVGSIGLLYYKKKKQD